MILGAFYLAWHTGTDITRQGGGKAAGGPCLLQLYYISIPMLDKPCGMVYHTDRLLIERLRQS